MKNTRNGLGSRIKKLLKWIIIGTMICIVIFVAAYLQRGFNSWNTDGADAPPGEPYAYSVPLEGNKFVFHMTPPGEENAEHPPSGLYDTDGSGKAVYTLDVFIHEKNFFISEDGLYCVEFLPSIPVKDELLSDINYDATVLTFYQKGQELQSYKMKSFTENRNALYQTREYVCWATLEGAKVDDNLGEFYFRFYEVGEEEHRENPREKRSGIFDLQTGGRKSDWRTE